MDQLGKYDCGMSEGKFVNSRAHKNFSISCSTIIFFQLVSYTLITRAREFVHGTYKNAEQAGDRPPHTQISRVVIERQWLKPISKENTVSDSCCLCGFPFADKRRKRNITGEFAENF